MSKIKKALDNVSATSVEPISYPENRIAVSEENSEKKEVVETKVDLNEVDWSKFTIDGVVVVDLLIRAINTLINKYYSDDSRETDGLSFTFKDIYEIAGIDDVEETAASIRPEEESLASLYDEEGYNWRYYCTLKALERFETDANWDVEINDNGYDSEFVKNVVCRIFDPISNFNILRGFSFLDFTPMLTNIYKNINKQDIERLTLEKLLLKYSVVMTFADDAEEDIEEDEDKVVNDEKSQTSTDVEQPQVSSRVVKPQVISNIEDFLKEVIGSKIF